jgi:hypothetical protein
MADPISLAGTAVGVLSLGIQVCKGICDYIAITQGRNDDLALASAQIMNLKSVFEILNVSMSQKNLLPKLNVEALRTLQRCMSDIAQGVNHLQKILKSIEISDVENSKAKLKQFGQKVTYSFRQSKLSSMQARVESLMSIASLAFHLVNLWGHPIWFSWFFFRHPKLY